VAPFNQTHTFALSTLLQPKVEGSLAPILNNNQLGIIIQANSGLPFNIRTNRDLNGDGNSSNDRPLGIGRNTGRLGKVINVDARYVRFINFGKRRIELFGEGKNIFNKLNISSVNRVVATDALGNPTTAIPSTIIQCGSPAVTPCATPAGWRQAVLLASRGGEGTQVPSSLSRSSPPGSGQAGSGRRPGEHCPRSPKDPLGPWSRGLRRDRYARRDGRGQEEIHLPSNPGRKW